MPSYCYYNTVIEILCVGFVYFVWFTVLVLGLLHLSRTQSLAYIVHY